MNHFLFNHLPWYHIVQIYRSGQFINKHLRLDDSKIHPNYFYSNIKRHHAWIVFWKTSTLIHLLKDQLLCIWFFWKTCYLQLWTCTLQWLRQYLDLTFTFFTLIFIFWLIHLIYLKTLNYHSLYYQYWIICLIDSIEKLFLQL